VFYFIGFLVAAKFNFVLDYIKKIKLLKIIKVCFVFFHEKVQHLKKKKKGLLENFS